MADILGSLSFFGLAGVVMVAAGLVVFLLTRCWRLLAPRRLPKWLGWASAVGVPFGVAYCAYWWPAWSSGGDLAQYDAWEPLGVGVPFVAALLPSIVIVLAAQKPEGEVARRERRATRREKEPP
jgi:hypothetical protein